jgi:hypothetical protein
MLSIVEAMAEPLAGVRVHTLPGISTASSRTIEFQSAQGGGLIAFTVDGDTLLVELYRCDSRVRLVTGAPDDHGRLWLKSGEPAQPALQASCPRCHDMFRPKSERALNGDRTHERRADGRPCGGLGQLKPDRGPDEPADDR